MLYACYQVARTCRRSRRTLAVVASGLTQRAASELAHALRTDDLANEDLHGYNVQTMGLHAQVTHISTAETMAALAAGPVRMAA